MSGARNSVARAMLLGCILFDAAIILMFFQGFSLFSILTPVKSLLMLVVLGIGLLILNIIAAFPHVLARKWGSVYAVALSGLGLLYAGVSNLFSVLLIHTGTITFVVWELLLLSVFLLLTSVILFFSNRRGKEVRRVQREQVAESMLGALLREIEELLHAKHAAHQSLTPLVRSFERLKERLQASTPFYRITGNPAVADIEQSIHNHLTTLHIDAKMNMSEEQAAQMQSLIQDIQRLVRQREQLIVK